MTCDPARSCACAGCGYFGISVLQVVSVEAPLPVDDCGVSRCLCTEVADNAECQRARGENDWNLRLRAVCGC